MSILKLAYYRHESGFPSDPEFNGLQGVAGFIYNAKALSYAPSEYGRAISSLPANLAKFLRSSAIFSPYDVQCFLDTSHNKDFKVDDRGIYKLLPIYISASDANPSFWGPLFVRRSLELFIHEYRVYIRSESKFEFNKLIYSNR